MKKLVTAYILRLNSMIVMIFPTIGPEDVRAVIYGSVYACLFVVNSVVNLFLLVASPRHRRDIVKDWEKNRWRAGVEIGAGVVVIVIVTYAVFASA